MNRYVWSCFRHESASLHAVTSELRRRHTVSLCVFLNRLLNWPFSPCAPLRGVWDASRRTCTPCNYLMVQFGIWSKGDTGKWANWWFNTKPQANIRVEMYGIVNLSVSRTVQSRITQTPRQNILKLIFWNRLIRQAHSKLECEQFLLFCFEKR